MLGQLTDEATVEELLRDALRVWRVAMTGRVRRERLTPKASRE